MTTLANIPAICEDGLAIGGWCIPWLAVGLALGAVLLAGVNLMRSTRQLGRRLDGEPRLLGHPPVPAPRVSLVRLVPTEAAGRRP